MEVAIIIVVSIILLTLILCFVTYYMAFYSPKKRVSNVYDIPKCDNPEVTNAKIKSMIDDMLSRDFEEVYITSYDGKKLYGRFYNFYDGAPILLQFHGYRGSAERDMCGGNKVAYEKGYNCLIVDQRSHGKSDGVTITFGIKERHDVISWVEYLNKRFNNNCLITISGVSMGGATVLMASDLNLPKNVIGILADCPYSSPKDIIKKVVKEMGFPPSITYPFIYLGALIYGHVNLHKTSAEKALKNCKIPVLIVHGEEDKLVPCQMSTKLQQIKPDFVRVEIFKNAGHGLSFIVDTDYYLQLEDEFWKYCIKNYQDKKGENLWAKNHHQRHF